MGCRWITRSATSTRRRRRVAYGSIHLVADAHFEPGVVSLAALTLHDEQHVEPSGSSSSSCCAPRRRVLGPTRRVVTLPTTMRGRRGGGASSRRLQDRALVPAPPVEAAYRSVLPGSIRRGEERHGGDALW